MYSQSVSQAFGIGLILSLVIFWQASLARFLLHSCVPITGHDGGWEQGTKKYNKENKIKNVKIIFVVQYHLINTIQT